MPSRSSAAGAWAGTRGRSRRATTTTSRTCGSTWPTRWRCWRGPSWINVAWLLLPALASLGLTEDAQRIASGLVGAVGREGLREYYEPRTGRGLGAVGFAWSALAIDLIEVENVRKERVN